MWVEVWRYYSKPLVILASAAVTPDVRRLWTYLEAVGEGISASDMAGERALDATENGKSAAEIAGGIAGSIIGSANSYASWGQVGGSCVFLFWEQPVHRR